MTPHKYAIGQIVDFDARVTPLPRPSGRFEVTRVLPAEDVRSQTYRIKSKAEPFERSAKEYEIVAVRPAASELAATFGGAAGADRAHSRWAPIVNASWRSLVTSASDSHLRYASDSRREPRRFALSRLRKLTGNGPHEISSAARPRRDPPH